MLTKDDLQAIGQLIDDRVPKIIEETVPKLIKTEIDSLEERMDLKFEAVHERIEDLEGKMVSMESRMVSMESQMVTKDFLERRLAKTDGKVNSLINVLERKRHITEEEKRAIHLS